MTENNVNEVPAFRCVGCSVCNDVCPADAIAMKADDRGFLHPVIDECSCIECGICLMKCPVAGEVYAPASNEPLLCCAAYARDDDIRYNSTSGGLFSVLAKKVLSEGGVVFGASYEDGFVIKHTYTEDVCGLRALRQSKYAQSDKRGVYYQVKQFLDQQKTVMFAGCPCEIEALKRYLGKDYKRLLLVDFLCLGVNSPKVYSAYIEALENRYRARVTRIWFKNKELSWNRFSTRVDFSNGKSYRKDRYTDAFMRGYIIHPLYVRHACTNCEFKGMPHGADITLGDFWGVESVVPGIDTSHGVSVVFVNTEAGKRLLEGSRDALDIWEVDFAETKTPGNVNAMSKSVKLDPRSDAFFTDLERGGFMKAIDRNAPDPLFSKVKRTIKWALGR